MAVSRPRYNKKRKRRSTSRYKQGYYIPQNPEKYRASLDETMNSGPNPFYRSSWEKKFYIWCDLNDDIEFWGTESIAIPYISPKDGQRHRYFPDVLIKFKNEKKVVIEIKPASQNKDPVNIAKWESAEHYCKQIGAEFVVMNEKHLGV